MNLEMLLPAVPMGMSGLAEVMATLVGAPEMSDSGSAEPAQDPDQRPGVARPGVTSGHDQGDPEAARALAADRPARAQGTEFPQCHPRGTPAGSRAGESRRVYPARHPNSYSHIAARTSGLLASLRKNSFGVNRSPNLSASSSARATKPATPWLRLPRASR